MYRVVALLLLLLLAQLAAAQIQSCRGELERAAALAGPRPGLRAAALLHRAHRLVEPAFPRQQRLDPAELPLAPDAPGFASIRYLAERGLLPAGWQRDHLDAVTWQRMIDRFTRGYGLERVVVSESLGSDTMLHDTLRALDAVASAVRPAALIATDQQDGEALVFLASLWNWTPHPRLLLFNPAGRTLADGIEALLARIGTCALRFERYVIAREATAARLFLGNYDAGMVVVGSEPDLPEPWPRAVAAGDEIATLSFADPQLRDLDALSLHFTGSSPGFLETVGLYLRVRTNLSPAGILHHLAFPPAR